MIQTTSVTSEEDNVLLSSICTKISELSVDNVEDPDHVCDLRGLRQDWDRLQSHLSAGKNPDLEQQRVNNLCLDEMSKEAKNITTVGDEQCTLSDRLLRKTREDRTTMDKLHMALTELCFAINYDATVSVWEAGDTAGKGPGKGGSRTRNRTGRQD